MVEQGPDFHCVIRAKEHEWHVVNFSGKVKARRKTCKNAKESAERLNMGMKLIPERLQTLRDYPKLRLVKKRTGAYPYRLVAFSRITVKSFKKRFVAEWWLERYNEAREARRERETNTHITCENEKSLLDAVEKRWLLADSRMLYKERVAEIESLLRMGLA